MIMEKLINRLCDNMLVYGKQPEFIEIAWDDFITLKKELEPLLLGNYNEIYDEILLYGPGGSVRIITENRKKKVFREEMEKILNGK